MKEYEILIEEINPCGGDEYAKKTFIEAEIESPKAYVAENGRYPVLEITEKDSGETVINTGDGNGYFVRYTFYE